MPAPIFNAPATGPSKVKTLLLLSCSRDKRSGGGPYDISTRNIPRNLSRTGRALLAKRQEIASMLRHDKGYSRLYNKDQKGGFRDERECNCKLKIGPDLGGEEAGGFYLPAHERYSGRFFSRLNSENPDFWESLSHAQMEVMFVSGLYGLLYWDELIQEYDCHFDDHLKGDKRGTLGAMWKATLTSALSEMARESESQGAGLAVFDLLSEFTYQNAF